MKVDRSHRKCRRKKSDRFKKLFSKIPDFFFDVAKRPKLLKDNLNRLVKCKIQYTVLRTMFTLSHQHDVQMVASGV